MSRHRLSGWLRVVLIAAVVAAPLGAVAFSRDVQAPPGLPPDAGREEGLYPPEQYERPPQKCLLEDLHLAGAPISATALKPIPGAFVVDHNDVIPLIGIASDFDILLQTCRCQLGDETLGRVPCRDG